MNLLESILSVCMSDDGSRLVPKRNINWLKDNHADIHNMIVESFPNIVVIRQIIAYLSSGIMNEGMIPLCDVCKVNNVVWSKSKNIILKQCSNRCSIKSDDVQEKTRRTCEEKYGKRFNHDGGKHTIGEHYLQKHLVNLDDINNHEIMSKLENEGDWKSVAEHFNLTKGSHSSSYKFMRKHGYDIKQTIISHPENDVIEFVKTLGVNYVVKSRKIIAPYELDVYFPDHNLAIEFNGIYWHSTNKKEMDSKYKTKHLNKTEMCEKLGIKLLHIFENEWCDYTGKDYEYQDIWKSVIMHNLGLSKKIYARKCKLVKIDVSVANQFCKENHLQGSTQASFAYGLYHEDNLVMVSTFGKSRYSKVELELIRMCSLKNHCVVGGASKILKNSDVIGRTCVSYGNRRWCSVLSNVYDGIGKFDHVSDPCYWYVKNRILHHRSSFMKHKLKGKIKIFDESLSEVENMYSNGFRRIWDCGNLVYYMNL